MLTCKGYTLSKHFAYVELLCTLHKSPDLQQSVNTSHFLQIPPAADSLLSTFRAFLPHPMPARRQPRCFARLNTWGQKPKEGREEKKNLEKKLQRLSHGGYLTEEAARRSRSAPRSPSPAGPPSAALWARRPSGRPPAGPRAARPPWHGSTKRHGPAGRDAPPPSLSAARPLPSGGPGEVPLPQGGTAPSSPLREFRFLIGRPSRRSEDATNQRRGIELGGLFGAGLRLLSPPGLRGSPARRMAAAVRRPSRLLLRESSWGNRSPPQGEAPCFIPRENKPFFFL